MTTNLQKVLVLEPQSLYNVGRSGRKWVEFERLAIRRRSAIKGELELMFLGQYEHSIDDKGRMTIPFRYRELLSEGAYITRGFDQNLMVLTAASFQRMSTRINQQSITDPNARALKRLIFAHADAVDVDKVGRILIPQYLRDDALLKSSAMVIGVSDHFEIWAPPLWAKQLELLDNPEVNSARYSYLDLTTE